MNSAPPSLPDRLASTREGIRAAMADEGIGLAMALQKAILRLLDTLIAMLLDFQAGRLVAPVQDDGPRPATPSQGVKESRADAAAGIAGAWRAGIAWFAARWGAGCTGMTGTFGDAGDWRADCAPPGGEGMVTAADAEVPSDGARVPRSNGRRPAAADSTPRLPGRPVEQGTGVFVQRTHPKPGLRGEPRARTSASPRLRDCYAFPTQERVPLARIGRPTGFDSKIWIFGVRGYCVCFVAIS